MYDMFHVDIGLCVIMCIILGFREDFFPITTKNCNATSTDILIKSAEVIERLKSRNTDLLP